MEYKNRIPENSILVLQNFRLENFFKEKIEFIYFSMKSKLLDVSVVRKYWRPGHVLTKREGCLGHTSTGYQEHAYLPSYLPTCRHKISPIKGPLVGLQLALNSIDCHNWLMSRPCWFLSNLWATREL